MPTVHPERSRRAKPWARGLSGTNPGPPYALSVTTPPRAGREMLSRPVSTCRASRYLDTGSSATVTVKSYHLAKFSSSTSFSEPAPQLEVPRSRLAAVGVPVL